MKKIISNLIIMKRKERKRKKDLKGETFIVVQEVAGVGVGVGGKGMRTWRIVSEGKVDRR